MNYDDIAKDHRAGRKFGEIKHNAKRCAFSGCINQSHARGLCTGHWNQWNKGQALRPLQAQHRVKDGLKFCPDCERHLPVSDFHVRTRGQVQARCGKCYNIFLRCKTYGLTRDEVLAILADPTCQVCGVTNLTPKNLHIDHCHTTGNVRGILCNACNTSLGLMQEDPARLRALADYAERHQI